MKLVIIKTIVEIYDLNLLIKKSNKNFNKNSKEVLCVLSNTSQSLRKKREEITAKIYLEKYSNTGCTARQLHIDVNKEMSKLYPDDYKPCSLSTIKRYLANNKNSEDKLAELYKPKINDLLVGTSIENFEVSETFIIKVSYEKAPMIASMLMDMYDKKIIVTVSHEFLTINIIKEQDNSVIKGEIFELFNIK